MQKNLVWFISRLSVVVFAYLILVFGILGFADIGREGDSLNYHIPIAESFLEFKFYNPDLIQGVPFLIYQPGVNEGILASFLLFGIPINTFNVIGALVLFLACVFIARKFDLDNNMSILFAGSITTLHIILRWINTQIIDVWMLIWFLLTLGLLNKIENNPKYFLILGISTGLLAGSKYTGPVFLIILFIFYFDKLLNSFSLKNLISFLIPFIMLGGFWYIRNFYYTGNPYWPESFLFFRGDDSFGILNSRVWETTFLRGAIGIRYFIDALISEFTLWAIAIFTPFLLLFKDVRSNSALRRLIIIGVIGLVFFAFLPSDRFYNIVVSVFRYALPVFVTLILALFVAAQSFKKEVLLAVYAMTNFLFLSQIQYRPKLVIIMLPVIFIIFFPNETKKFFRSIFATSAKK